MQTDVLGALAYEIASELHARHPQCAIESLPPLDEANGTRVKIMTAKDLELCTIYLDEESIAYDDFTRIVLCPYADPKSIDQIYGLVAARVRKWLRSP